MKLNEYLYKRIRKRLGYLEAPIFSGITQEPFSKGDIEKWIVNWYMGEFSEIGCGKGKKPLAPPSWLANWRKNE